MPKHVHQYLVLLFSIVLISSCITNQPTNRTSFSKQERFKEAMEHEFDKTHDKKLGYIPTDRLLIALNYYKEQSLLKGKTSPAFADIEWKERGPNNIGGRTRAILFLSSTKVLAAGITGGLWKTNDITASNPFWKQVDTFALSTVNVSCIAQDPNNSSVLYLGTGEAFGSNQVGSGIYKSTDGGVSWDVLTNTKPSVSNDFSYVAKILVASDGNVYAACKSAIYCNAGGLMRSTNSGLNWSRVVGTWGGTNCSDAYDFIGADVEENGDGDLFYSSGTTGINGHVFISDKGTHGTSVGNSGNWTDITPSGSWGRIEMGVTKQTSSEVIYIACQGSSSADVTGLYYSSDNGANWTSRSVPTICDQGYYSVYTRSQAYYDLVVEIDPSDDATAYFGGIDMLKTTNNAAGFTQITNWSGNWPCSGSAPPNIHADQHALVFNPYTSNAALSGNDGGLYYSTNMNNSTPTWTDKNEGFNVTQYYAIATHPSNSDYVIGGTQDNGSHKLTSYGTGSGTSISGGDGGFCHILQTDATYQLSSYVYNYHYLSSNSGTSFASQSSTDAGTGRFINPSDLDDANELLFSAGNANILEVRSGVASTSLSRSTYNLGFNNNELTALKVSPNNANVLYVGDDAGNIYKIEDRATTPAKATWGGNVGANGYISSIDVWESFSGNDDSIMVTLSSYGVNSVYLTINGTNSTPTWTDIDDNNTLQDIPVRWGIFSKESHSKIFIGTDVGVLATNSINGNSTAWTLVNNDQLPYVRVDMMEYDADDNLVIGTHGRGIWETQQPCNLASELPTATGIYTSAISHNDGSFTCFCTSAGELLLALDTFGSGAVVPETGVSLQIAGSGNSTISWSNAGGIITNPNGGAIIDRKWNVSPTTQPSDTVKVRYFFTAAEYADIITACGNLSPSTTITNPNQLNFYKLIGGSVFADPHASGASGIILSHGSKPSTSVWTYSSSGSDHIGDFLVTSFSGGGGGGGANGGALPVSVMSFDVKRLAEKEALMVWNTASEFNNKGFEIERSYNNSKFETIGWVNASENPNQVNEYIFLDTALNPTGEFVYYRFKQLDYDGKFEYSEIKRLKLSDVFGAVLVYPNPASSLISVRTEDLIEIRILDLNGRTLIENKKSETTNISSLPNGAYVIEAKTLRGTEYRNFIKN